MLSSSLAYLYDGISFVCRAGLIRVVEMLKKGNVLKINCVLFQNFYGLCLYALKDRTNSQKAWIEALKIDKSNTDTLYYLSNAEVKDVKGIFGWISSLF